MRKSKDPALTASNDVTPGTRSAIRRYALIAIPLFVVVGVFFFVFFPKIQVGLWINGLHSDETEIRREMRQNLLDAASENPEVYDWMADAIGDDSRGFNVRQAVVGLLIESNRLSKVLDAYADGNLDTRTAILARMQREEEFNEYWASDANLAVKDTVRAWLARDNDFTRHHAIQIAMQLEMKDTMPLIRPLLVRSSSNTVHADKKRDLLIAAVAAVNVFQDCESIPTVAQLAKSDPHFLVRIRAMQNTYAASFGVGTCKGTFDEAAMQALVADALGDEAKEVRMAAMLILEKESRWARTLAPQLRAILDNPKSGAAADTERRHALHALITVRDPDFLVKLPLYFLDANPFIRSSCAHKSILFHETPHRMESCLIGLMRNEVESDVVFMAAQEALRRAAGKWHGLTPILEAKARDHQAAFHKGLRAMFDTGEMEGISREAMAEAWFRWLALDLGLEPARLPSMVAAWKGFWAKADQGDAKGARAALAKLPSAPSGLFRYENAWLQVNEE